MHLDFMDRLADAAEAAVLPHFRQSVDVENKKTDGFDPVTVADRAAEEAMRSLISQHYPNHGVLGEEFEAVATGAEHVWILDPIDGTRAFICGLPTWGTLIGLKSNGFAQLGMMTQPFTRERYFGDGRTAQYNGPGGAAALKTRTCAKLEDATLFCTTPQMFSPGRLEKFRTVEDRVRLSRYGIDCYAYVMLARGLVDLVIEDDLKPYDIAALIPIIEGAGGRVTTWSGDNAVDGGSILASGDPDLHEAVLDLLAL